MDCTDTAHILNMIPLNVVSWQKQVKKGYYMKGSIKAAKGAVCPKCACTTFRNIYDEFIGYSVPKCAKCFGPPNKLKVTKLLPGNGNEKAEKKDLYRDLDMKPLTKISQAIALIGKLNDELKGGTFRPEEYNPKAKERLKFNNYADEYLDIIKYRYKLPEGHEQRISKKTLDSIVGLVERELRPFFKDTPINDISQVQIQQFKRSYLERFRTRDLALGLLRTMLRYAFNELNLIDRVPPFQKIPKARRLRVDEIPTKEIQVQIIEAIDKEKYKAMFILMATLGIRPCEVRAYRVSDVDLKNNLITAQGHFSRKDFMPGRKSIDQNESMGVLVHKLDSNLVRVLSSFMKNRKQNEFLFQGERGPYVCESALWEAWERASKKLGIKKYRPYAGTKSASATDMIKKGHSMESVRGLLGHKNAQTTEIYANIAAIDTEGLIDSSMFKWGSLGVLENGALAKAE